MMILFQYHKLQGGLWKINVRICGTICGERKVKGKTMEYVLKTHNLKKSYGKYRALDGLDMNVPKGAIYGLVGKNGAGKTTLIRLLCGLQRPTEGDYELYGVNSRNQEIVKSRRRMGAVVETPSVYQGMTAEENLQEQYRILGLPDFEGISELLQLVGLENTGKKKAGNFSLGMRQRLGIAIALAGSPDFLVLDEPVNGLDPQGIVEIRELILKLNREQGITVLISSHILDELARIATYFGFVDRGRMIKEISAAQLETVCRKCIRMKVSDTRVLSRVLDEIGLEYAVLSENEAEIYGKIGVTELTLKLSAQGCQVEAMQEKDESLENYYINLVGGGKHE